MRTLRSESKMKGSKFNNTFEEAINLDNDDFVNIHSGGSSVVMLSREPLAKKKANQVLVKKTKVIKIEVSKEDVKKKGMKKRKTKRKNVVENEDADVEDDKTQELQKISCRPVTLLLLTYADKVVLNGYNLRRSRPLINQIDSVDLEMLEEHGLRNGEFGTLEFRADGEVDPIDVNGDEDKVDVESIEKIYSRICDDKEKLRKQLRRDNISPTNEVTMKTPVKVAVNPGQSNFVKGSSFVKGNSPICNVQSTGRNNEKTKIMDGCDSPSVLFLEYKGNTSLDSPVVLTPGF
ncbi:unnamed protein product [Lactuca virosa]|uniref:Uncharacterized protein n=1 Tax=Lactuca virosa TaxID=75947 RepID=A0AAU9MSD1_9ASTR|nr:unnamed protein product [Lactuca virosa]